MKTLPTALAAHYASGTTTLADLLKITRKDGQVFAFTSASTDVTISGQLYTSAQGLDISSLEVTAGLAVDNLELTTLDDGSIFSRVEVLAGVWRNADFVISRYNWANPIDGIEVRMVGTVGEVHLKRGSITAELRGLQQYLQQPIGSVTSKTCRARLGDALCRVNMSGFTHSVTIDAVASNQVFSLVSSGGSAGDPNWSSVVLAMHMDGANSTTSFTDVSTTPKTITRFGDAKISTAQSKFGGASAYFDGSGDYLTVPSHSDFEFASGDFTIEMFIKTSATKQNSTLFAKNSTSGFDAGSIQVLMNSVASDGKIAVWVRDFSNAAPLLLTSGVSVIDDTWHHVAIVKYGSSNSIYVDGVSRANATASYTLASTTKGLCIADDLNFSSRGFLGYIDDIRITKGVARYTANFTPPASEFLGADSLGISYADDYLADGLVTFTSGANSGLSAKVKTFAANTVTLSLPMISTPEPGDAITVVAGCRKRLEDCSGKFNNVLNFQGEPHLPGVDQITAPA